MGVDGVEMSRESPDNFEPESLKETWTFLSALTRHGVDKTTAARNGVTVNLDGVYSLVSRSDLRKEVDAISPESVDRHIGALVRSRLEDIELSPSGLLKLRASLILGVGGAEQYDGEQRRRALTRTYMYPQRVVGLQEGAARFRNEDNLDQDDREALLRQIAERLEAALRSSEPAVALGAERATPGGHDGFEVLTYQATRVMPESSDGQLVTSHDRVIRATVAGLKEFRIRQRDSRADAKPPHTTLVSAGQARIENLVPYWEPDGARGIRYDFVVEFEPMALYEEREISWTWTFPPNPDEIYANGMTTHLSLTPRIPVTRAKLGMKFDPQHLPAAVWHFVNVIDTDRFDIDEARRIPLEIVDGRAETPLIENPRLGQSSGISCEW
jgi:hypothetical protein